MKQQLLSRALALAACLATVSSLPALADQVSEQGQLRKERRAGTVRSTREIEQIVLPQMPGMQYLGPEYDAAAMAYRLKFIQNGRVVFVDVDARSGRIIGRSR
ncbi:PepSY domain-containing protein [uncultured Novosphingobium sp.]|uniref:PepSY domain-containing protein n=1 Tax=uncultured Novosphingobium sp. TaxID=292277 RepID=UPI00258403E4|nr:PepSY domain-containing protein [uncultured Novosphingobium sp.]